KNGTNATISKNTMVIAQPTAATGLAANARMLVIIAVTTSRSRSSSSGKDTKVIEKSTIAKSAPTALPRKRNRIPSEFEVSATRKWCSGENDRVGGNGATSN